MVLVMTLILFLAGCSAPPITIEGEENAKAVYTCSPDNMFGLERIVIFQTETVVVFDMQKCDLKGYGSFYLIYTRNSDDGKMKTYTQKYDPVKGTWGKIEHSVNDVPATELNSTLD